MPVMKSRVMVIATVSMLVGFLMGEASARRATAQTASGGPQASAPKPAYLIASGLWAERGRLMPYIQAALPLERKAGMEPLASGELAVHVLEGSWKGELTLQRYRSLEDLLAFWNSPEYQEAKKLREGLVDLNFIVAIEGR